MIHVLVSSERPGLADALRAAAPESTTFVSESGVDATLERLSRSARIDGVVTDSPEIAEAIRDEIPGSLPVHVARADEPAKETWAALLALIGD